ncbi:MAG: hypothetical protein ACOX2U_10400 [Limisphaerales bacterium]|jgi:cell division protein FtsL|nr:hypothetical protein [Verrucomicrobiota bacterium]
MNTRRNKSKIGWKVLPFKFALGSIGLILLVLVLGVVHLRLQQQNHDLGERLRACEFELRNIRETNSVLSKELGRLKTPENILRRAGNMGLELSPVTVTQIVRIPEVEILTPGQSMDKEE